MENGKQGAFACVDSQKQYLQEGLTKREYFAGLAMQGLCTTYSEDLLVKRAVIVADALLAELEKTKSE
jgi:hypothetical protein